MTNAHPPRWALLTISMCVASGQTHAEDPLGLYIGAAVGQADVKDNQSTIIGPLGFSQDDTGWKVLAGLRPLPVFGAEVEYIDFGNPTASYSLVRGDVSAKGAALFGVGYLPIPLPFDVFAKAGLGRISTSALGTASCPAPLACGSQFQLDRTETKFAYGAGIQGRLRAFAIRAEYERVDVSIGNPNLLSLGLTWTF
jgi:hypothetical protein